MKSKPIVLIVFFIFIIILIFVIHENFKPVPQYAVIIRVNETTLDVMLLNENNSNMTDYVELCEVSFANEGNIGFDKGQEILIYYDGIIDQTYPLHISRSKKD